MLAYCLLFVLLFFIVHDTMVKGLDLDDVNPSFNSTTFFL